jgi:hypothetical protein
MVHPYSRSANAITKLPGKEAEKVDDSYPSTWRDKASTLPAPPAMQVARDGYAIIGRVSAGGDVSGLDVCDEYGGYPSWA